MAYMTILKKTESQLQLLREPTFFSKSIFIGFLVGVTGVILFGSESLVFKVFIGFCAIFLSYFMVENYEICDVNKETSEVRLTRMHFCQYFLGSFLLPPPYMTCKLANIQNVMVEDHVDNSEISHRVAFVLNSGDRLGITEKLFTNYEFSDYEKIVETIVSFIGDKKPLKVEVDADYEGDGSSSEDDYEDDGFEQISKADLEGMEEQMAQHDESPKNTSVLPEKPSVTVEGPESTGPLSGHGDTAVN